MRGAVQLQACAHVRSRAIAAAAPVHTAAGFQAACPPAEGLPGGALGAIAGATCAAIRDGGLQEDCEEVYEITTLLLEVHLHIWM